MVSRHRLSGVLLSTALPFLAQGVFAEERPRTQKPQQVLPTGAEDAPATKPAAAAARTAATEADLDRQLEEMTNRSDEGLSVVTLPNGARAANLEGRFMSVMLATPAEGEGALVSCHQGKDAVDKARHAQAVAEGKAPKAVRAAPMPARGPAAPGSKPVVLEEK